MWSVAARCARLSAIKIGPDPQGPVRGTTSHVLAGGGATSHVIATRASERERRYHNQRDVQPNRACACSPASNRDPAPDWARRRYDRRGSPSPSTIRSARRSLSRRAVAAGERGAQARCASPAALPRPFPPNPALPRPSLSPGRASPLALYFCGVCVEWWC